MRRHSDNVLVRIRWDENVDNKHCVDFYVLKYWQEGENPNHKKHTDTQIKPTLEGNKLYNFQVIAFQVRNFNYEIEFIISIQGGSVKLTGSLLHTRVHFNLSTFCMI